MHILIAPNAFKHALDAPKAAACIRSGLLASRLSCTCECFPIGDGGNGTCRLIIDKLHGEVVKTRVADPLGRPVEASYGLIHDRQTAVIEMADSSGLHLLKPEELAPLRASSYGTGQLMTAALAKGVKKIILGMGGSATVDGGSGILSALGVRFLDRQGKEITALPSGLAHLHAIDASGLDKRLASCTIDILCDVANPLLGRDGAAHVFGPQKGASPADVAQLEEILAHYAQVVLDQSGRDITSITSGGVAGGASAGLFGLLDARLVNGIDYFLQLTDFLKSLEESDLVITGEGSLDGQTLYGKGPYGVALQAKEMKKPVIGLAGKVPMDRLTGLEDYFDLILAIGNGPMPLENALQATAENLERVALQIGNLLSALNAK
ncbi:glycerate kinase [Parapedobacter sp. ISTM3]|uniref:Glycerate kinase n=1 Tax=Parapedobacter luteus TaxID=623280 RepID=A0A1T5AH71_9SPHI|nr:MULTISPECIES: glycerate kinase [Parapedobacter]MBK1441845.1 glycerate kinase [Parapedobacter sp. ISTM3]SKB33983.1 glycerate kinase [Parapedobacter luteus]